MYQKKKIYFFPPIFWVHRLKYVIVKKDYKYVDIRKKDTYMAAHDPTKFDCMYE